MSVADSELFNDLPAGWTYRIRERSVGVYDVFAIAPSGHTVSRSGSDVGQLAKQVSDDAHDIERQLRRDA
jgi:hypothetical protein